MPGGNSLPVGWWLGAIDFARAIIQATSTSKVKKKNSFMFYAWNCELLFKTPCCDVGGVVWGNDYWLRYATWGRISGGFSAIQSNLCI